MDFTGTRVEPRPLWSLLIAIGASVLAGLVITWAVWP